MPTADFTELRRFAAQRAADLSAVGLPKESVPCTKTGHNEEQFGFMGMKSRTVSFYYDEQIEIGWSLWSRHILLEKTVRDGRDMGDVQTWAELWLTPEGNINYLERCSEFIVWYGGDGGTRWHHSIRRNHLATDDQLSHPDMLWEDWRDGSNFRVADASGLLGGSW